MAVATFPRTRTFLLRDLTPATRRLFRAFRDAQRAAGRAYVAREAAYGRLGVPQSALHWMEQGKWEPTADALARVQADLVACQVAYDAADAVWRAAVDAAGEAFRAARPAMEAEGYPAGWWNGGSVRIPRGVSPDNPRLRLP